MLFFRWLVYSIFAITNYPSWKSLNPNMACATLRYQTKSSPKSPQTTIKQHPEKSQLPTNNHPTTSCKSLNPGYPDSDKKNHQLPTKNHPITSWKSWNPENPKSLYMGAHFSTHNTSITQALRFVKSKLSESGYPGFEDWQDEEENQLCNSFCLIN